MLAYPAKLWLISTDLDADDRLSDQNAPAQQNSPSVTSRRTTSSIPQTSRRVLDDGVEDRLHLGRRAADDAEHLGCRRLMLQGFAQFRVALLDFFEQPHVLDRDHGLVGESFEERDLLVGERTDLSPTNQYASDGNTLTQ